MPHFSVELREPHSFMKVWMVLAAVLILLGAVLAAVMIVRIIRERRAMKSLQAKNMTYKEIAALQKRYLGKCAEIETELAGGLGNREAYQKLSETARMFVYEATDLQVQNCTLSQITRMGLPPLRILVEDYYDPEFAEESLGNIGNAIARTRSMISSWTHYK